MKPNPVKPNVGQESVWDYPQLPRLEPTTKHIRVLFNGIVIADTRSAWRILKMGHPPTYYLPPQDVQTQYFLRDNGSSLCHWKGQSTYYTIVVKEKRAVRVAWVYHKPDVAFKPIQDYFAIYAHAMDACYCDGELVIPQSGHCFGGWITSDIVGPFKGDPGSWCW